MATDVAVPQHGTVGKRQGNEAACCKTGPGYATPLDAMSGPKEALIYVTAVYSGTQFHFWSHHEDLSFCSSWLCLSFLVFQFVFCAWDDFLGTSLN